MPQMIFLPFGIMERRQFTREFKPETVRLNKDRGVSSAGRANPRASPQGDEESASLAVATVDLVESRCMVREEESEFRQ